MTQHHALDPHTSIAAQRRHRAAQRATDPIHPRDQFEVRNYGWGWSDGTPAPQPQGRGTTRLT